MNKAILSGLLGLSLGAAIVAAAEPLHDWHDLEAVHTHVVDAIGEMDRASKANHYDMAGHARKAESSLHNAEEELRLAIDTAKAAH